MIIYIPWYDYEYSEGATYGPFSSLQLATEELTRRVCYTLMDGSTHLSGQRWVVDKYELDGEYKGRHYVESEEILAIWEKICEDSK